MNTCIGIKIISCTRVFNKIDAVCETVDVHRAGRRILITESVKCVRRYRCASAADTVPPDGMSA